MASASDLWDDPDLLQFEDPARREIAAARMRRVRLPGSVIAARWILFLQPLIPIVIPAVMFAIRGDRGQATSPAGGAAVTTTTVAVETAQRRGGGGGFLVFALVFLGLIVGLIVLGAKLGRITPGVRAAAIGVEALLVVGGGAMLAQRIAPMPLALAGSAVAAIALLLSPSTKAAMATAGQVDTSARFDVRSLPSLDR
jgi:hypothetical protein